MSVRLQAAPSPLPQMLPPQLIQMGTRPGAPPPQVAPAQLVPGFRPSMVTRSIVAPPAMPQAMAMRAPQAGMPSTILVTAPPVINGVAPAPSMPPPKEAAPAPATAPTPTKQPEPAPEPVADVPAARTVEEVWESFWSVFIKKDVAGVLLHYDESSQVRWYNNADGKRMDCQGLTEIGKLYEELFPDLERETFEQNVADVDEDAGQVFLVFKCPGTGMLTFTSTFIYARNFKIWKQNIVVTKVSRVAAELASSTTHTPQPQPSPKEVAPASTPIRPTGTPGHSIVNTPLPASAANLLLTAPAPGPIVTGTLPVSASMPSLRPGSPVVGSATVPAPLLGLAAPAAAGRSLSPLPGATQRSMSPLPGAFSPRARAPGAFAFGVAPPQTGRQSPRGYAPRAVPPAGTATLTFGPLPAA
mmetsp:Transcript_141787/g.264231  ORF Transcript_141787/g.264231 Transcript_141787/m.264231 type:complete len:415 (+) Transcript_141787:57-1301(+)